MFEEKLAKKLVDQYVGPYFTNKVVSTNVVKLQLPTPIKIHLVVNISQIVQYRKQVEEQKIKKIKLVKVEGVEEWEVKKILDKRKIQEVMAKHDTWKKKKNLENIKKIIAEFERKINTEVRW